MKNLLSLYALTKSLTFWLFILLVIAGLFLPSAMMEGYGKFAAALILFSLGFEICRLFNINTAYYLVFTGIVLVAIQPAIGIILLISALIFFSVASKSPREESNQEIAKKAIDQKLVFTAENIMDLTGNMDPELQAQLAYQSVSAITAEDLISLEGFLDDDALV